MKTRLFVFLVVLSTLSYTPPVVAGSGGEGGLAIGFIGGAAVAGGAALAGLPSFFLGQELQDRPTAGRVRMGVGGTVDPEGLVISSSMGSYRLSDPDFLGWEGRSLLRMHDLRDDMVHGFDLQLDSLLLLRATPSDAAVSVEFMLGGGFLAQSQDFFAAGQVSGGTTTGLRVGAVAEAGSVNFGAEVEVLYRTRWSRDWAGAQHVVEPSAALFVGSGEGRVGLSWQMRDSLSPQAPLAPFHAVTLYVELGRFVPPR